MCTIRNTILMHTTLDYLMVICLILQTIKDNEHMITHMVKFFHLYCGLYMSDNGRQGYRITGNFTGTIFTEDQSSTFSIEDVWIMPIIHLYTYYAYCVMLIKQHLIRLIVQNICASVLFISM